MKILMLSAATESQRSGLLTTADLVTDGKPLPTAVAGEQVTPVETDSMNRSDTRPTMPNEIGVTSIYQHNAFPKGRW
jgi:hypothetical protein